MDIRERTITLIRNTDKAALGSSLLQKAKIFCWETGLGPVINALPAVFGQQAVLYFPGRSGKYSLSCFETEGRLLMAAAPKETEKLKTLLLQSPGVEVWLKDGWFAGTARLLTEEEQADALQNIPDEQFFGIAGSSLSKRSLKEFTLLEVTRNAPCTGSSGPGSRSWIWPLAALLLLFSKKKK